MAGSNKTLKSNESILNYEIYDENTENLPHNEQNLQINDDPDNYDKYDETKMINKDEDNLRAIDEKINTQSNSNYSVLKDSCLNFTHSGEPFKSQHIKIDFTSVPGVDDNAFLQQKCIDFWKFVNEHPELKSYEIEQGNQNSRNEIITDNPNVDQGCSQEIGMPAVKMLQRPDISQNMAFATKLKYTVCEHLDNDYSLSDAKVEQRQVKLKKRSTLSGPKSYLGLKSRSCVENKPSVTRPRAPDDVNKLCSEMEQWDLSHPKSMEPPKRVPFLSLK